MTPAEWEALNHQDAQVHDDINIHYVDIGPRDATPVVLVHGWPGLSFSWRYQVPELARKYRVILPDMRGFARSSAPKELSQYGSKNVTSDLARLLDILEIKKAVFIGHDWGGAAVWWMCLHRPDRVLAVASVCTMYWPPEKEFVELEVLTQRFPELTYWSVMSQTESTGEMFDQHAERVFTSFFRRHNEHPEGSLKDLILNVPTSTGSNYTQRSSLLTKEDIDYYVREFARNGFQPSLNWYAMYPINYEDGRDLDPVIPHPTLYIGARNDAVLKPEFAAFMPNFIPNLEMTVIENAGHWVLWEQREQVTQKLLQWLEKVGSPTPPAP